MCREMKRFAIWAVLVIGLNGCRSRQTNLEALQKKYDQLGNQFKHDCSAEYLNVPPKISPRCAEEDKKVKDAWDQLQAERAKQ